MSSSDSLSSDSEIREYSENKPYKQLERGEIKIIGVGKKVGMRCPFCVGKKPKEYDCKQLVQHAEGVWGSKRKSKERANHLALANFLKKKVLDEGTQSQEKGSVPAESSQREFVKPDPLLCFPWTGILAVKGVDNEDIFTKQYVTDQVTMYKPTDIVMVENNGVSSKQAIINFGDTYQGWYMASRFETFYESEGRGKKDYLAKNTEGFNIYGWFAGSDDYVSPGVVGDFLRDSVKLQRFSDVVKKQEQGKKKTIDALVEEIDAKNKAIEDLNRKMKTKK